ncbi:MAG: Glycosyl transferase family 2 [Firmicutes bacterium ADurb.Bin456]|nr:MAG: Glycosyl transferase family 2 [Firmicutes bacterium ADurb.Bin456]
MPFKVAVCIATCRRPRWLGQLLESLTKLEYVKCPAVKPAVIVVDNDYRGSARAVAGNFSARFAEFIYELEPVQNISLARNRTVALAKSLGCTYAVFVDDDEFVEPRWLDELLFTLRVYDADIVRGPVIPVFSEPVPEWVMKGGFFELHRLENTATGERIRWGATNNVLIKRELLDRLEGPFDPAFGLTGGEDTHLFERLHRLGARMVWSNEAVVRENVPSSRTNVKWILLHYYSFGSKLAQCDRALATSKNWLIIRLIKGVGRILQGSLLFLPSLFLGYAAAVKSLSHIARGAGMLAGICGCKSEEYKVIHGS